MQGLPLPLLKICDFGYSKAHFMSAPKSKVWQGPALRGRAGGGYSDPSLLEHVGV